MLKIALIFIATIGCGAARLEGEKLCACSLWEKINIKGCSQECGLLKMDVLILFGAHLAVFTVFVIFIMLYHRGRDAGREYNERKKEIANYALSVLVDGDNGIFHQYEKVKKFTPKIKMTASKDKEHVPVCKNTQVQLSIREREDDKEDPDKTKYMKYHGLSANYIRAGSSRNRFICAGPPPKHDMDRFWVMLAKNNCDTIVTIHEKDNEIVDLLQTTAVEFKDGIDSFKIKINKSSDDLSGSSSMKMKKYSYTVNGNTGVELRHYIWTGWPDNGVPQKFETDQMKDLEDILKSANPILLMSKNGCGRPGTFAAILTAMDMTEHSRWIWPLHVIARDIRAQRVGAIVNEHQYLFIVKCVLDYLMDKWKLDEKGKDSVDVDTKYKAFCDSYKKFGTKDEKKEVTKVK